MQPIIIGMIVPPAEGAVPPEAYGLYPEGIRFAARGLGLKALTLDDYAVAIERVRELAIELRDAEGAEALSLMGTSLSFFRGGAFNDELVEIMQGATGLPATTMSNSIRDALWALGARRVAVGTAYADDVNQRLQDFLEASGFEVASLVGLNMTGIKEIMSVGAAAVSDLGVRAAEAAQGRADAVLVSCGGLPALHLAGDIEARIGMPVVASATAGVWGAVRLAGMTGDAEALGTLGRASIKPARMAG